MMFSAVIRNKDHPEYGEATIPFPVKAEDYDEMMSMMEQGFNFPMYRANTAAFG